MQQLQAKSKNVPRNTSLVPCSTTLPLNREETLSVVGKLLTCNNLEVNLRQHIGEQNLRVSGTVYAIGVMEKPCTPFIFSRVGSENE